MLLSGALQKEKELEDQLRQPLNDIFKAALEAQLANIKIVIGQLKGQITQLTAGSCYSTEDIFWHTSKGKKVWIFNLVPGSEASKQLGGKEAVVGQPQFTEAEMLRIFENTKIKANDYNRIRIKPLPTFSHGFNPEQVDFLENTGIKCCDFVDIY